MKKIIGSTPEIRARRKRVAKLFPTTTYDKMAEKLGVLRSVIESDARSMGLLKTKEQKMLAHGAVSWDDAHIEILRLMRPVMETRELASLLGRSEKAIGCKATALGLRKVRQPKPKAPKAHAAVLAPKESATQPVAAPAYRGPPPMTDAQIAQREKLRITYPPDQLPWKARVMWGTTGGLPDLSHRSS